MGNSIKNHSELTFTGMANLSSLYTKLKFLKRIESNTMPGAAQKMKSELITVTYTKENVSFKANVVKPIYHNLKTKDVKVKIIGKNGAEVKGKMEIVSENKINFTAAQQTDNARVVIEGKVKKKPKPDNHCRRISYQGSNGSKVIKPDLYKISGRISSWL
jgi:hypothetical protein